MVDDFVPDAKLKKRDAEHFYIFEEVGSRSYLVDLPLLEYEVQKAANGRIIHDVNVSLSNLRHAARSLVYHDGKGTSRSSIQHSLFNLRSWGVLGIPPEVLSAYQQRCITRHSSACNR